VYKYNVGDFPLTVIPCKHFWCRYAVYCLLKQDLLEKLPKKLSEAKSLEEAKKMVEETDCQFIKDQSKCPDYEPSEHPAYQDIDNLPKGYCINCNENQCKCNQIEGEEDVRSKNRK